MALIKCPECGKEMSEYSSKCIYCGHIVDKNKIAPKTVDVVGASFHKTANNTITTLSDNISKVEAYDVMIIESCSSKTNAKNDLSEILAINKALANDILESIPCYIYEGVQKDSAEIIANRLVDKNFRVVVYNAQGEMKYFEPDLYFNKPLPNIVPLPRKKKYAIAGPMELKIRHITMPKSTPKINSELKTIRKTKKSKTTTK